MCLLADENPLCFFFFVCVLAEKSDLPYKVKQEDRSRDMMVNSNNFSHAPYHLNSVKGSNRCKDYDGNLSAHFYRFYLCIAVNQWQSVHACHVNQANS